MKMEKHEDGAEYHTNITQDDLPSDDDLEAMGDWGGGFSYMVFNADLG